MRKTKNLTPIKLVSNQSTKSCILDVSELSRPKQKGSMTLLLYMVSIKRKRQSKTFIVSSLKMDKEKEKRSHASLTKFLTNNQMVGHKQKVAVQNFHRFFPKKWGKKKSRASLTKSLTNKGNIHPTLNKEFILIPQFSVLFKKLECHRTSYLARCRIVCLN